MQAGGAEAALRRLRGLLFRTRSLVIFSRGGRLAHVRIFRGGIRLRISRSFGFSGLGGILRIFNARVPYATDLVGPCDVVLLGPCDGVVCALFQGLRNAGGLLPLLGGGTTGHGEPDHRDPFVCFFYIHVRSLRPQAEGIVKVLPDLGARQGDELRLGVLPPVPEGGISVPVFIRQQILNSGSVLKGLAVCVQITRAALGLIAAQEILVLLDLIHIFRAVGGVLSQALKGEGRFHGRLSLLLIGLLHFLGRPCDGLHQFLFRRLSTVFGIRTVQMEAHGGIGDGVALPVCGQLQNLLHRQAARGTVVHVLRLEGVGGLAHLEKGDVRVCAPVTHQGGAVGACNAGLPQGVLIQAALRRVFGKTLLVRSFRPDLSVAVTDDVLSLIQNLEGVVVQPGPVADGQRGDGLRVKVIRAAPLPLVQGKGHGGQVLRRIAGGQVGPELPSLDGQGLVQAVDKGAAGVQGVSGIIFCLPCQSRGMRCVCAFAPFIGLVPGAQTGPLPPVFGDGVVKLGGIHIGALHRGVDDLKAVRVVFGQVFQQGLPDILLGRVSRRFGRCLRYLALGAAGISASIGLLCLRREQALVRPAVAGVDQLGLCLRLAGMHGLVDVQVDVRAAAGLIHVDVVPLLVPDGIRHAGAGVGEGDLLGVVL